MTKPFANNYSWYPVNYHHDVDSKSLKRINLTKEIQIRLDTKKVKVIVIRDKAIEKDVPSKRLKIRKLKNFLNGNFKTAKELENFIHSNLDYLLKVLD